MARSIVLAPQSPTPRVSQGFIENAEVIAVTEVLAFAPINVVDASKLRGDITGLEMAAGLI
jgi:hypothetical protein